MVEKILIVDDEKEIADLIEVYLQNENMDVYKFYSGEEVLVCLGSTDYIGYHASGYQWTFDMSVHTK